MQSRASAHQHLTGARRPLPRHLPIHWSGLGGCQGHQWGKVTIQQIRPGGRLLCFCFSLFTLFDNTEKLRGKSKRRRKTPEGGPASLHHPQVGSWGGGGLALVMCTLTRVSLPHPQKMSLQASGPPDCLQNHHGAYIV